MFNQFLYDTPLENHYYLNGGRIPQSQIVWTLVLLDSLLILMWKGSEWLLNSMQIM